jgi:hypothetical protein
MLLRLVLGTPVVLTEFCLGQTEVLQPKSGRHTKLRIPPHQQPAFLLSLLLPPTDYEVGSASSMQTAVYASALRHML